MVNSVGAEMSPCLTPLSTGIPSERAPLKPTLAFIPSCKEIESNPQISRDSQTSTKYPPESRSIHGIKCF